MAIHETKIKWHDLVEDPNDLPMGEAEISFIVLYNKETKTTDILHSDHDIDYLEHCNCWRITPYGYDEDGNPEPYDYIESYRHEPIDSEIDGYLLYNQVVIAWSEKLEVYVLDISKLKEEPDESD